MLNNFLADVILICHLLFILFVVFGGILLSISKKIVFLHIPALVWGISIEFFGWICPLTPLENRLREAGNRSGYSGGFIEHYLVPIIYPDELTRNMQFFFGLTILLINIIVYMTVIVQERRKRTK